MALDLAQREVGETVAVQALIQEADSDVRVMRRAHRHCELAVSVQWPAAPILIRAFDYLSAGRRALEFEPSHDVEVVLQPLVKGRVDRPSLPSDKAYDLVDEASMESFPASDAPSFWGR